MDSSGVNLRLPKGIHLRMRKERDNNDVQTDITAVLPAVLHFCVTIQTSDVGS